MRRDQDVREEEILCQCTQRVSLRLGGLWALMFVIVHSLKRRTGTAAQIRSQVSAAFSAGSFPDGSSSLSSSIGTASGTFLGQTLGSPGSSLGTPFVGSLGGVSESIRPLVSR